MPHGASPSGQFSLNSPPPTLNLCFWLCLLAVQTARAGFTLSLCEAAPTNPPMSLLWEFLVMAVPHILTVAHLCDHSACQEHRYGGLMPRQSEDLSGLQRPEWSVHWKQEDRDLLTFCFHCMSVL